VPERAILDKRHPVAVIHDKVTAFSIVVCSIKTGLGAQGGSIRKRHQRRRGVIGQECRPTHRIGDIWSELNCVGITRFGRHIEAELPFGSGISRRLLVRPERQGRQKRISCAVPPALQTRCSGRIKFASTLDRMAKGPPIPRARHDDHRRFPERSAAGFKQRALPRPGP
jgi:hypothetical protein